MSSDTLLSLRQENARRTRLAILRSARGLFGTRGYGATSIADIANRARVTHGAVYAHFEGKSHLFEQVWDAVQREWFDEARSRITPLGSTIERLTALIEVLAAHAADPAFIRITIIDGPTLIADPGTAHRYGREAVAIAVRGSTDASGLTDDSISAFAELFQAILFAAGRILADGAASDAVKDHVMRFVRRIPHLLDLPPADDG